MFVYMCICKWVCVHACSVLCVCIDNYVYSVLAIQSVSIDTMSVSVTQCVYMCHSIFYSTIDLEIFMLRNFHMINFHVKRKYCRNNPLPH